MKAKDLNTIETFIAEYGMKPGAPTPVGQQQSATSASVKNTATPNTVAKDVKQGDEIKDADGNDMQVVGKVDNNKQVVAKTSDGEYAIIDANSEVEVDEAQKQKKKILKKLSKLQSKVKHAARGKRFKDQGEAIFEINFNNAEVIKTALDGEVSCGFEAEVTFPDVEGEIRDLDDMSSEEVLDMVEDREGYRAVEVLRESYSAWMWESDEFMDIESSVIDGLAEERMTDQYYIDEFVNAKVSDYEVEEFADETMGSPFYKQNAESYADWNLTDWGREYATTEHADDLREYIIDDIRDNGEQQEDAIYRFEQEYDMDYWARREGGWETVLNDNDIYVSGSEGGGVEEVSSMLENWASTNSYAQEVQAGSYHAGAGDTEQNYWRVEDDSSIEGEGAKAEIISPVYDSPREMLAEMKSLFEWLEYNNAETNSSTGLHVTMSLRGEQRDNNPLKIALLLGDKYALRQFGREFNSYAKSQQAAVQKAAQRLKTGDISREGLEQVEQVLSRGINYGKFSSINFKDGMTNNDGNELIEFRIGGGDEYHSKFDVAAKSAIRYAATMLAGHDENAYREDYIKSIVKIIDAASGGYSDTERAELEKGAGLDIQHTAFTELLKTVSGRDRYLENLKMYKLAVDGDQESAYKILNGMVSKHQIGGMGIKLGANTARAMRVGMKDMGVDLKAYADSMTKRVIQNAHSDTDVQDALNTVFKALSELIMKEITPPKFDGPKTIKMPEDSVIFLRRGAAENVKAGAEYAESDIKSMPRDTWSLIARVLVALDDLNSHSADALATASQLDKNTPEFQKYLKFTLNDFVKKYGFVPESPNGPLEADKYAPVNKGNLNKMLSVNKTAPARIVTESVFDRFDKLPLQEQLSIISKVDKTMLDEAWNKKQQVLKEGAVPEHNTKRDYTAIMSKPLLGSDIKAQMDAYFVVPDPSMIKEFRNQISMAGKGVDLRNVFRQFANKQLHPDQKDAIIQSNKNKGTV